MPENNTSNKTDYKNSFGYHDGEVETVISVDDVNRQAQKLAEKVSMKKISGLVNGEPFLKIESLNAGYGKMEILHDFNLQVGKGQSLCMIGPNGAGKSTVLHSIFGFTRIFSGKIMSHFGESHQSIAQMSSSQKLKVAGISYILQDNSVFPDMTVEENLLMGAYLKENLEEVRDSIERIFEKYDRLKVSRSKPARVLSGGERRLLEISRALVMEPSILLVDEPSIGLEPRFIDMVFEILDDLQRNEGKTILMVEQNAKKGLEFCDIGYVLVSGNLAMADTGDKLLENPDVGRLFLGG